MGKRSTFERVPKDLYRTIDPRAVQSLLPFLVTGTTFAEPCMGFQDLIISLENCGHYCNWRSDITPDKDTDGVDALTLTSEQLKWCECIITNPPWTRTILHPMIQHFMDIGMDSWLLFDSDWCHTKQSSELLKHYCTDIVSIGRLIWIPGTKTQGKDNCAWYRFSPNKSIKQGTMFHGR